MPRFVRSHPEHYGHLVEALAAEFAQPAQQLAVGEQLPLQDEIVIEETSGYGGGRYMLSVIWKAWRDVPAEERGRIILDAVARARGEDHRLRVGLALGLTPEEYQRIRSAGGYPLAG